MTPEQIAEGRRLREDAGASRRAEGRANALTHAEVKWSRWLAANAPALLDAAEENEDLKRRLENRDRTGPVEDRGGSAYRPRVR